VRIEEISKLIPSDSVINSDMIGTWELVSFLETPKGPEITYPDFVHYHKLLTPTHFCWVRYNDDGDVSGTGAGTYRIEDDRYIENPLVLLLNTDLTWDRDTFHT